MITIKLFKADEFNFNLDIPSQWNELEPAEILFIARSFLESSQPLELKAQLLVFLIESRAALLKIKLPKKWKAQLDPEQFFLNGSELLNFIFDGNDLTNCPEQEIELQGTRGKYKTFAPENGFAGLTSGEMEDADAYYTLFVAEKKVEHLAMLAAILWRLKGIPYQIIVDSKFTTYPAQKWAPMFEKLEPHRLYSIYIWYTGCKSQLPKMFPVLHEPSVDSKQAGAPDPMSFTKCIHAGAGAKNGTREHIRLMPAREFLYDMELEAVKAKELKIQMDNAKS